MINFRCVLHKRHSREPDFKFNSKIHWPWLCKRAWMITTQSEDMNEAEKFLASISIRIE